MAVLTSSIEGSAIVQKINLKQAIEQAKVGLTLMGEGFYQLDDSRDGDEGGEDEQNEEQGEDEQNEEQSESE